MRRSNSPYLESKTPPTSPMNVLTDLLERLGQWVMRIRMRYFMLLILVIGVIRIGPLGIGPDYVRQLSVSAESFPTPVSYLSSGLGPTFIISLIGEPSTLAWWIVGSLIWIGMILVLLNAVRKSGTWAKPAWILIVMSPAFILSVSMLGQTDMFTIAGSLLIACGRKPITLIAGIVIVPLGNPEQAFASSLILLLVALALREKTLLSRSLFFLASAGIYFLCIQIWFHMMADSDARVQLVIGEESMLVDTTRFILGTWPLSLYAAMGPLWIALIVILFTLKPKARWIVFFALVIIPIGIQTVTFDGTRDFVIPGLAGTLALFITVWRRNWKGDAPTNILVGGLFLILVLSPALIIDSAGTVRMPYDDWLREALNWSRVLI